MSRQDFVNRWLERARTSEGPIYLGLVSALEAAIRTGELQPGDQLPTQRACAQQLGVDFTTVTRAYNLARQRGLVDAAVGRGTFVSARPLDDEAGLIDLSMNLPPSPEGLSIGAQICNTAQAVMRRSDPAVLLSYHPGAGTLGQKGAGAAWLRPCFDGACAEHLLLTPGAQTALAAALATVCRAGDRVAAEPLTYPGFRGACDALGLRPVACAADAEGLRPDALERLHREQGLTAVYIVPTMQNPVATTMGEARRRDLASMADRLGLWIIEDDPYSRLMETPIAAVASFAPDRTFFIATLSKCLTPGLRTAYMACPPERLTAALASVRALALMPAPLMSAVVTAWIREGTAETLLAAVRSEARARRLIAAASLPEARGAAEALHVWRALPDSWSPERLLRSAQERGLSLVAADAFAVGENHQNGVRISLGGPSRRSVLASALGEIGDLLRGSPPPVRPMVV